MVSPHSAMLCGYRHCGSGDMNITVEITYREKGPSNKTPTLTKSTNVGIQVVGTLNQPFIRGF